MRYIPPFSLICDAANISARERGHQVTLSYDDLLKVLRMLIAGIKVDEAWYLAQNQDVAAAIQAGTIASAQQHFVDNGIFEGRLPFPIAVDERWYLLQHPDVAANIRRGIVASGQRHFEDDGYQEGRLPFAL
jgi:hypothetical protein